MKLGIAYKIFNELIFLYTKKTFRKLFSYVNFLYKFSGYYYSILSWVVHINSYK